MRPGEPGGLPHSPWLPEHQLSSLCKPPGPEGPQQDTRTRRALSGRLFCACSQAVVAEELLSAHGARVLHVHQAVHTEGEEAAAQEAPAASAAAGWGRGSPGGSPHGSPLALLLPRRPQGGWTLPVHAPWLPPQPYRPDAWDAPRPCGGWGGTHPNTKRPVHSIQVRTPGTGVVTVMT